MIDLHARQTIDRLADELEALRRQLAAFEERTEARFEERLALLEYRIARGGAAMIRDPIDRLALALVLAAALGILMAVMR